MIEKGRDQGISPMHLEEEPGSSFGQLDQYYKNYGLLGHKDARIPMQNPYSQMNHDGFERQVRDRSLPVPDTSQPENMDNIEVATTKALKKLKRQNMEAAFQQKFSS